MPAYFRVRGRSDRLQFSRLYRCDGGVGDGCRGKKEASYSKVNDCPVPSPQSTAARFEAVLVDSRYKFQPLTNPSFVSK